MKTYQKVIEYARHAAICVVFLSIGFLTGNNLEDILFTLQGVGENVVAIVSNDENHKSNIPTIMEKFSDACILEEHTYKLSTCEMNVSTRNKLYASDCRKIISSNIKKINGGVKNSKKDGPPGSDYSARDDITDINSS